MVADHIGRRMLVPVVPRAPSGTTLSTGRKPIAIPRYEKSQKIVILAHIAAKPCWVGRLSSID